MIIVVLIILIFFIYLSYKKISFHKDRSDKEKIIGEFVKYKLVTEKVLRNEYHTSEFPFVKINDGKENVTLRLNFKNSLMKEFKKGEKVELFWCDNKLLYWNAYNIGFLKFLPKNSLF